MDKEKNLKVIFKFWKQLTISIIILAIIFFAVICLLYIYYREEIIIILSYFEISYYKEYLLSLLIPSSMDKIWWIIAVVFLYFSIFAFIKRHNVYALSEETKEAKYFSFILSLYGFYNFIVISFILPFYLLLVKKAYIELLLLLLFYGITNYIFLRLFKSYVSICQNYSLLESVQPEKVKNLLESRSKLSLEKYKKYVNSLVDVNSFVDLIVLSIIHKIIHKASLFQSTIFTLSILSLPISFLLSFNLLSSIYIILTLIIWFYIISIISVGFPKEKIEIELVNKEKIGNVFLIEDNPKGYYFVLTKSNQTVKVMKNSIATIKQFRWRTLE